MLNSGAALPIQTAMSVEEDSTTVVPLGRDGRPRQLRRFRVRPASTLKDDHEQVLALVGQNFARLFAADLATFVGAEVDITMGAVQQWSWDDLLAALPDIYCAARLSMPPLEGTGMITVEVPLATAIVEKLMGGPGVVQERSLPLTEVELSLLGEMHQRAVGDLAEALSLVVATKPAAARQESRLELIRASTARSLLITIDFEVKMHGAAGHMRIALPAPSLVESLANFAGTSTVTTSVESTGRLGGCPVETSVRFNDTELASGRVVELAPGDLIVLDHQVDRPLTLYVGEVPYLPVLAGRRGNHKAFAVVEPKNKGKGARH